MDGPWSDLRPLPTFAAPSRHLDSRDHVQNGVEAACQDARSMCTWSSTFQAVPGAISCDHSLGVTFYSGPLKPYRLRFRTSKGWLESSGISTRFTEVSSPRENGPLGRSTWRHCTLLSPHLLKLHPSQAPPPTFQIFPNPELGTLKQSNVLQYKGQIMRFISFCAS